MRHILKQDDLVSTFNGKNRLLRALLDSGSSVSWDQLHEHRDIGDAVAIGKSIALAVYNSSLSFSEVLDTLARLLACNRTSSESSPQQQYDAEDVIGIVRTIVLELEPLLLQLPRHLRQPFARLAPAFAVDVDATAAADGENSTLGGTDADKDADVLVRSELGKLSQSTTLQSKFVIDFEAHKQNYASPDLTKLYHNRERVRDAFAKLMKEFHRLVTEYTDFNAAEDFVRSQLHQRLQSIEADLVPDNKLWFARHVVEQMMLKATEVHTESDRRILQLGKSHLRLTQLHERLTQSSSTTSPFSGWAAEGGPGGGPEGGPADPFPVLGAAPTTATQTTIKPRPEAQTQPASPPRRVAASVVSTGAAVPNPVFGGKAAAGSVWTKPQRSPTTSPKPGLAPAAVRKAKLSGKGAWGQGGPAGAGSNKPRRPGSRTGGPPGGGGGAPMNPLPQGRTSPPPPRPSQGSGVGRAAGRGGGGRGGFGSKADNGGGSKRSAPNAAASEGGVNHVAHNILALLRTRTSGWESFFLHILLLCCRDITMHALFRGLLVSLLQPGSVMGDTAPVYRQTPPSEPQGATTTPTLQRTAMDTVGSGPAASAEDFLPFGQAPFGQTTLCCRLLRRAVIARAMAVLDFAPTWGLFNSAANGPAVMHISYQQALLTQRTLPLGMPVGDVLLHAARRHALTEVVPTVCDYLAYSESSYVSKHVEQVRVAMRYIQVIHTAWLLPGLLPLTEGKDTSRGGLRLTPAKVYALLCIEALLKRAKTPLRPVDAPAVTLSILSQCACKAVTPCEGSCLRVQWPTELKLSAEQPVARHPQYSVTGVLRSPDESPTGGGRQLAHPRFGMQYEMQLMPAPRPQSPPGSPGQLMADRGELMGAPDTQEDSLGTIGWRGFAALRTTFLIADAPTRAKTGAAFASPGSGSPAAGTPASPLFSGPATARRGLKRIQAQRVFTDAAPSRHRSWIATNLDPLMERTFCHQLDTSALRAADDFQQRLDAHVAAVCSRVKNAIQHDITRDMLRAAAVRLHEQPQQYASLLQSGTAPSLRVVLSAMRDWFSETVVQRAPHIIAFHVSRCIADMRPGQTDPPKTAYERPYGCHGRAALETAMESGSVHGPASHHPLAPPSQWMATTSADPSTHAHPDRDRLYLKRTDPFWQTAQDHDAFWAMVYHRCVVGDDEYPDVMHGRPQKSHNNQERAKRTLRRFTCMSSLQYSWALHLGVVLQRMRSDGAPSDREGL